MNTASYRGRGPQQPVAAEVDGLGPAVRALVPASGLHPDLGGPGSRSGRAAIAGRLDHRHHFLRRLQRAVLSHGAAGAGLRRRSQRGASVAVEAEARGACGRCRTTTISGVSSARAIRTPTPRCIASGCVRCSTPTRAVLGQPQSVGRPRHALFHRRVLSPRHARPLHRLCPCAGESGTDRSRLRC